jgi:stage II sporulation protein D
VRLTGSLFIYALFFSASICAAVPNVKVLIGKSLKDIVVNGTDLRQTIPAKKLSREFHGHQTVNFNCRLAKRVALPNKPLLIASVSSPTGLVGWEEKRFRGELQLVAGPDAAYKGCDLVNLVPMDTYISSLLAKEMRADWPIEALKAQAVVARSYALAKMRPSMDNGAWDLESSEKNQVSGNFYDTTPSTDLAARVTEGEVLADSDNKPVEGFFHSKCGGKTLRPDQVWIGSVEGYKSVDCPFCHKHGKKSWKQKLSKSYIAQLLSRTISKYTNTNVRVDSRNLTIVNDRASNSSLKFYQGSKLHTVRKSWLRNMAGRDQLPSHNFQISESSQGVKIEGEGFGHGVGMCQLGAMELAKRGYSYKAILQHYFPGLNVSRIW